PLRVDRIALEVLPHVLGLQVSHHGQHLERQALVRAVFPGQRAGIPERAEAGDDTIGKKAACTTRRKTLKPFACAGLRLFGYPHFFFS
ncbi:hypothetical protein, partial [Klebsiella pneumoniae]|uniref:hypothetical protein n=1 Tax=Klebsiella pneumoniae TaxID=573 RepID=UPI002158873F